MSLSSLSSFLNANLVPIVVILVPLLGGVFWLGIITEKLRSQKKDVEKLKDETKDLSVIREDVKELKKETRDISSRFDADLLARNLLDKLQPSKSKPKKGEQENNNE